MNSALALAHNKNLATILDFSPLTAHIKFVIKFCGLCFGNIQNPATSHFPHHLLDYYSNLLNGFFAFVLMPFGLFNTTAKWFCENAVFGHTSSQNYLTAPHCDLTCCESPSFTPLQTQDLWLESSSTQIACITNSYTNSVFTQIIF